MSVEHWRTGPITITGADGQVGTALQHRLAGLANEIRPLGRTSDLADAFADAEAVVHLAGTLQPRRPNTYRAANLDTVRATAAALKGSAVQRIVFLSFVTADPASPNPYLRFKAQAEQLLMETGVPAVVFRTGHVYGPPQRPGPTAGSLLADGGSVSVLGPGTQQLTPVYVGDVVEAITRAALDPDTPTGTFELAGPDTVTVDEFAAALNTEPVRLRHVPAWLARHLGWILPSLPRPLADVLVSDAVATRHHETAERFGIQLHALDDIWPPATTTVQAAST